MVDAKERTRTERATRNRREHRRWEDTKNPIEPAGKKAQLIGRIISRLIVWLAFLRMGSADGASGPALSTSVETTSNPLSASEAIASFRIEKGFRVELAAAEPTTIDPVAIAFDENGRMFVVEDCGYPTGPPAGQPPAGVIAVLEDTDGDGLYDKRTVFADGLTFPNGIVCWRGGVFVTCAPDIYYFKDTLGTGRANVKRVVLTGFDDTTTTQLRVSHPTLGLDGWIYLTSGLTGGKVISPEHRERRAVEFKKSDSRFRPDTLEFETVGGAGQFGMSFDEFGRRFICSNRNPLQHVVLEPRYLRRNPYLPFSETVQDVAPPGEAAKVWPISPDTTTASYIPELMGSPHAGTFTSACGCLSYRGDMLGPKVTGNAFVCEPAQNLVQRQVLFPSGASFRAEPAHQGVDFLTSADSWFRPVFAAEGPEDALYICDMYRKVIDHPQYLPEAVRAVADFDAGKDKGRIYRIVPDKLTTKGLAMARSPRLNELKATELCSALMSSNGWTRATAFRLLLERKDQSAVAPLRELASNSSLLAQTRVAALRLLDGMGELDPKTFEFALGDPHPGTRENACQLAESRLKTSGELTERVSKLGHDPDSRVRFQCALSLGEVEGHEKMEVLASIAMRDGTDRWARAAVLSSVGHRAEEFFNALMAARAGAQEALAAVMTDLSHIFGLGESPEKCLNLFNRITATVQSTSLTWQAAAVEGLAEGLRSRGLAHDGLSPLQSLISTDNAEARLGLERFEALIKNAMDQVSKADTPQGQRLAAVALLGEADGREVASLLLDLLTPTEPTDVQTAAVRAYGKLQDPELMKALVVRKKWRAFLPPVREAVLTVLMSQRRNFPVLLDALERGDIPPWCIEPGRRNQLMQHSDEVIKKRAVAVFKGQGSEDRQKVYQSYKSVLSLPGDGKNGHEVFKRICAQCHTHSGEGVAVGPDLTGVQNQPAEALLLHILIPSYEIVPGYTSYDIETKDGQILSGLIASETTTAISLKKSLGVTETILRSNIAKMSSAGLSLMPDELEKTMTRQELADLIAFLTRR